MMMMNSFVLVREIRLSETCFDMTSRSETTYLTRVSRVASDVDIKKRNSTLRRSLAYSKKTLSDCHVSQKTTRLMMMNTFVSEREMNFVSLKTIRE